MSGIFMESDNKAKRCENCIVRQFNDLQALNKDELKMVSDAKVTKMIKKGDVIFEEGEKLNGVFCIRDGVSKLSKLSSNGKDQIVKLITKGEILGQHALISEESVNLSATAVSDMEVCFIPKEQIEEPLKANPVFTMKVMKTMVNDLKESNDTILRLSQKSVKQRVAQALLYIQKNYGEDDEGFLRLSLSREDLANVVGTATESCIRTIAGLKKSKIIKMSGKKIGIVDANSLQKFVDDFKN
jgi:CRP-like cAMP-binding protein